MKDSPWKEVGGGEKKGRSKREEEEEEEGGESRLGKSESPPA